jgi:hypothetical protein
MQQMEVVGEESLEQQQAHLLLPHELAMAMETEKQ